MLSHPVIKALLICLSGFILSLSAPGYDLWFIAWFGLIPFFIIIAISKKLTDLVSCTFLFGASYNLSYLCWFFSLHPLSWLGFNDLQSYILSFAAHVIVSSYNGLFFVLYAMGIYTIKRFAPSNYSKGVLSYFISTILWLIVFNKLSASQYLLGFPWTLIEYSQYKNLYLIQLSEYLGSSFISFLIVFFNLAATNFVIWFFKIEKIGNKYIPKELGVFKDIAVSSMFIIALVSITTAFGFYLYSKHEQLFAKDTKKVCVLQGNLPIKTSRGPRINNALAIDTYGKLFRDLKADLFIAPEGALPTNFPHDYNTQKWVKAIAEKQHADIIFGTYQRDENKYTNSAVIYNRKEQDFSFYEKERLVPFGEFTPLSFILPEPLKRLALFTVGTGFSSGKQNKPLDTTLGKAGINICFEIIFPTIIRKHALLDAEFLVNLSDLSWFSNNLIKKQFLSFAVFRAIENRKSVVIASNDGISAFIQPSGKIKKESKPKTQTTITDYISPNNIKTIYAKYGW